MYITLSSKTAASSNMNSDSQRPKQISSPRDVVRVREVMMMGKCRD
jgi:hypothetical protein